MTRPAFLNLSPGLDRVGRACAWIEREDGFVLMTGLEWGGWTLPGGGIHPGETSGQAAVREAWEEAGAHAEAAGGVAGEAVMLPGDSVCVPLRLKHLEPSPEGRPVTWVNPRSLPWADDLQIREVLAARGETPPHLEVPALVWLAQEQAARLAFRHSCSPETGRLLRTLAASRPGGRVLELGTGTGVGAAWLLAGLDRAARLLTVEADPARAEAAWAVLQADPRARVQRGDWRDVLIDTDSVCFVNRSEHHRSVNSTSGGAFLSHSAGQLYESHPLGLNGLYSPFNRSPYEGPFDLIFADCAAAKADPDALARALKPGGTLIMDDFSPPAFMSPDRHAGDPLRDALFTHPHLTCTELEVRRRERVLLAVRNA